MAAFADRHIGPRGKDIETMLKALNLSSIEDLLDETLPADIRVTEALNLPDAASEEEALEELFSILGQNQSARALIGQGYYNCHVPQVIKRNLFENPAWYTAYTPYQPEISQGRLEMLFNYQTLVAELTGLPVSNASLLDEATAVAEGVLMAVRSHRSKRNKIVIGNKLFAQSLDVIETRAKPIGVEISYDEPDANTAALILQVPDAQGVISDHAETIAAAKELGVLVIIAADPMSLMLNKNPGELGADIAVGCMQRFGVPLGYGGPHAAYMSCKDEHKRLMPGRLIGQSIDANGNPAYRLALQTREQHIRREKATSNICTAQALLANMAAAYAIYHGPEGLTQIASRIAHMAETFAASAIASGFDIVGSDRFDTVTILNAAQLVAPARKLGYLVHSDEAGNVSVSFDETCEMDTVLRMCKAMEFRMVDVNQQPVELKNILSQEVFHAHRSETEMMRYLRKLADRDLALDRAMIPLGSCTMKLNAAAEMAPVTWAEISNQHPFVPKSMAQGTLTMISQLEDWLCEVTGFAGVSLQPNAGSQGEYAGLLAISAYHASRGEGHRNICIIPTSAHGTNPASAFMAGMKVVAVKCDDEGNIDVADLEAKAAKHSDNLAALMVTYPSTHGVFEASIKHICQVVHDHGGQVYLDGANLNAMVGLARPGDIGGDVCHMNLHKTFCIPHGGGGPGVGPIGVAAHLVPHLPGHSRGDSKENAVAATEHGSASILPISWMYVRMMGGDGLRRASALSILSANYVAKKLEGHFDILYRGNNGRVAHECIVDVRPMDKEHGVSVDDIAKRLIDYGFHAPTMSWPVAGTLMIEPTESEPLFELDRFCDAMIGIANEIKHYSCQEDSPLKHAPFTIGDLTKADWTHPFSREQAVMPAGSFIVDKYWPPVARVDNVYGDKNLICTCPTVEEMAEAA
ncbi:MAG: aminomethyl-transferring glycine dehydrogenase [Alphaproteobacteria bacterium]